MNAALAKGIKTLANTVSGLSAANFFYDIAKHDQTGLYCVFFGVDDTPSIDSGAQFEHDHVQFDFYGTNLSTLDTLVTAFKVMFDLTDSLSVSGYSVMSVTRTFERPFRIFGKVWQVSLEYEIIISKTRS